MSDYEVSSAKQRVTPSPRDDSQGLENKVDVVQTADPWDGSQGVKQKRRIARNQGGTGDVKESKL